MEEPKAGHNTLHLRESIFTLSSHFPPTFLLPEGGLWQELVDVNIVVYQIFSLEARLINLRIVLIVQHGSSEEKEMEPHSSVLAWRIPGMEEPGGPPSMGLHRVRHD